ncbi:MAG: hypothetical protein ACI4NV_05815 [Thermoguttaceae bacterium]
MLQFLRRVTSRDALVLYFLFLAISENRPVAPRLSYARLAEELTRRRLYTARGIAFTPAVVRAKCQDLVEVGLLAYVKVDVNLFDFTVKRVAIDFANPSSHFQNENENENENENQDLKSAPISFISLNKQINKPQETLKEDLKEKSEERAPQRIDAPQVTEARVNEADEEVAAREEARSVAEIRDAVDFEDARVVELRKKIVEIVWEPELNRDLVDRLVGAAVLRLSGISGRDAVALARNAAESRARYLRTDGRAGRRRAWETLGLAVKRIYDEAGWRWVPTRVSTEPKPQVQKWTLVPQQVVKRGWSKPTASAAEHEETTAFRRAPREMVASAPKEDVETSNARDCCEGFTIADLATPLKEFETIVARRFRLGRLQAAMKAATIRGALRDLAEEGAGM